MTTFRGDGNCVYESHTIGVDADLTEADSTATHAARRLDRPSVINAVCHFHARWLRERGGWTITPLGEPEAG